MMIEINGAGFANKGAQLMLATVLAELRGASPNIQCCMQPQKNATYAQRAGYGLYQMYPIPVSHLLGRFPIYYRAGRILGKLLPQAWCKPYGLVRYHDTDALLDISGFAFGDQSPWKITRRFAMMAQYYHQRNKPVIMLPQMFGPFTAPRQADMFRRVLDHTDLVFARDEQSLQFVKQLQGRDDHVYLAPDITIFVEPASNCTASLPVKEPYALLIPNRKVVDQGDIRWRDTYVDCMVQAGRYLIDRGVQVLALLHAGRNDDLPLVSQIIDSLNHPQARAHTEEDPFILKQLLAQARLIVASRYHSVVGALSSGVPSITVGWAHKYQTLHRDFGVPELLLEAEDGRERLRHLLDDLMDEQTYDRTQRTIRQAKQRMRAANQEMWKKTFAALQINLQESDNGHPASATASGIPTRISTSRSEL